MAINTEITVEESLWQKENKSIEQFIKSLIKKILPETKLKKYLNTKATLEISILLTNNKKIQELNKAYRNKNKPTNVLSFPLINIEDLEKLSTIQNELPIGDIVLSYEAIAKESLEQGKVFKNHLTHLTTHSILHLIGYDHNNTKEADIMEKLEIKILKKLDIDNPYIISDNKF